MDAAQVEDAIHAAITSERSRVIALVGDWGVGKTHLWKGYAVRHKGEIAKEFPKSSYVSLFGLTSTAEIRTAILDRLVDTTKLTDDAVEGVKAAVGEVAARRKELDRKVFKGVKGLATGFFGAWGKAGTDALQFVIDAYEYRAVRKALICLDDLERISKPLAADQVMGVIDDLARQRGCKVVVIFSPNNLGEHAQALKAYREKTFDREVRLRPPFSYAIEIATTGLPEETKNTLANCATRLGLRNIRVLRRIVDGILDIGAHVPSMNADIAEQILTSLTLLSYCHLAAREGEPTLDDVLAIPYVSDGEKEGQNQSHHEFLRTYGWFTLEAFDKILADYVKNGSCEWSMLAQYVEAANHESSVFHRKQKYKALWDEYYDRFMDAAAAEDFCLRFTSVVAEQADILTTHEIDNAMWLLREVGTHAQYQSVFDAWKARHESDRDALNVERIEELQQLSNEELRSWCASRFAELPVPPKDVREILVRISRDKSWGGDDTSFLAGANAKDFADALRQGFRAVRSAVKLFLNPNEKDDNSVRIRNSLLEAMDQLDKESNVNRLRLSAFDSVRREKKEFPKT